MKKQKTIDTIIIGAGAAGLGCAHQLFKHKKEFLILSKDIGGRIETSKDGKVNYGAYFVIQNYHHVLPYVKKGERLHPFAVDFHQRRRHYHLLRMARYPFQTLRLIALLYRFKSHYERFKKECETQSQKQCIEKNPFLKKLYTQTAQAFAHEKGIETIANVFLCEGVYMCSFLPLSQVSALDFLRLCLGLILPAHEFTFLKEKAIRPFKKKIKKTTVKRIQRKGEFYEVKTSKGQTYRARHVVVATPPDVGQALLKIPAIKKGVNAYVFHVAGRLKPQWRQGQFELFKNPSPVIFIREQADGTHIFYSKTMTPNLKQYFEQPKVLFKKEWQPAFNIIGKTLVESEQGLGLFCAGDYNLIGLEDSYITGLYAARQIIGGELKPQ